MCSHSATVLTGWLHIGEMDGVFDSDRKILIVGLGLMGGCYAQALSRAGYHVGGIDTDGPAVEYALSHGFIREGSTKVDREFIGRFDTVVFALYPGVFVSWIEKYQEFLAPGTLVTDVTGIKTALLARLLPVLRKDVDFVPAHPMAGRERCGIEYSDCSIFRDANFIITPVEGGSEAAVRAVEAMARVLGFRRISRLSPESHDEMIGFLSQLTHCIAVSLMTCKESSHLVDYTGDSFMDLTRIARINEDMWSELFVDNKTELLGQMDLFMDSFRQLRDALEREDVEAMKEMMRLSTSRRALFDRQEE